MRTVIGSTVSRYEILDARGTPGLGEGYLARDTADGRLVTLRILPADLSRDTAALARAFEEARSVCAPSHPHIITVHDAGLHEGRGFLVTEVAEGALLSTLLARGPMDLQVLLDFGVQMADALGAAHARGFAHGALGPDSILVTEGEQLKVMDFGVGRMASPERHVDPAGDVAAIGHLLRDMAAGGTHASGSRTGAESKTGRINGPELPGCLAPIVLRALGGPGGYSDAAEMSADLSRAMTEAGPRFVPPPVAAAPGAEAERARAGPRRLTLALAVLILAAIAVGILTCG